MKLGDNITLTYNTTGLSSAPDYYRWDLWDGTVRLSVSPTLTTRLSKTGNLAYTTSAITRGTAVAQSGTIQVDDTVRLTGITATGLGGEYPCIAHLVPQFSDSLTRVVTWLDEKDGVIATGTACDVTVSKPGLISATYDDGNTEPQRRSVQVWGTEYQQLAVSQISASVAHGRAVNGGYADFSVYVKNDGYSTSWSLGALATIAITDAVTVYGDYTRYKVRVDTSAAESVYRVSFTATKADKTKTVSIDYPVSFRDSFAFTGITYTVGGTTQVSGQPIFVDEGGTITCAYTGDLPQARSGLNFSDLYRFSWEYTNSKTGDSLPPAFGKTCKIDTTGLGGGTLDGYLSITDPYGNVETLELDQITVSRVQPPTLKLDQLPTNPVVSGVPVIISAGTTTAGGSAPTLTWEADRQAQIRATSHGSVINTSGLGGYAVSATAEARDDAGLTATASTTVTIGNRLATSTVVWNDAFGNKVEAGATVHFYACAIDPDAGTSLSFVWNIKNPVMMATGPSLAVPTSAKLAGTKITGTVTVYDTVPQQGSGTTYTIDDVLITGQYITDGTTPESDKPDCPTCSSGTAIIPAPVLQVTAASPLYTGSIHLQAFSCYYAGTGIVSMREVISAGNYSCDTGWVDAPNPSRYTLYRDWSSSLVLSSGCTSPFQDYVGELSYDVYVRTVDAAEYHAAASTTVSLPAFTNEDLGELTASCASGYCGGLITVHISPAFSSATTNQSYDDLGLSQHDPILAQEAVNARATTLASAELTRRTTDPSYCTLVESTCICGPLSDLDSLAVAKWSGDTRTAAQAAVLEILAGNWARYTATINTVNYTFDKTNVATGVASLCLVSALAITPDAYITLVFDSSGSMDMTLTPLQAMVSTSGKLYRALSNIYGADFSTKVALTSDTSELWVDFMSTHAKPSSASPARKQIILTFMDEDSVYSNSTASAAATQMVNYANDPAKFDYFIMALFAVADSSTPYIGTRWDYLYANNAAFKSAVDATATSTCQLRCVKNVTGGSTESYYFGLIQQVLASAGININDPDAV